MAVISLILRDQNVFNEWNISAENDSCFEIMAFVYSLLLSISGSSLAASVYNSRALASTENPKLCGDRTKQQYLLMLLLFVIER